MPSRNDNSKNIQKKPLLSESKQAGKSGSMPLELRVIDDLGEEISANSVGRSTSRSNKNKDKGNDKNKDKDKDKDKGKGKDDKGQGNDKDKGNDRDKNKDKDKDKDKDKGKDKDKKKLKGTDEDDILTGDDKNNHIDGKDGNDEIYGLAGNDHLDGGNGNDLVVGGDGNDNIQGGDGNDELYGGEGNDKLEGDKGNDVLIGGGGNDKLDGDDGNDILEGGLGKDNIDAGKGDDSIIWNAGDGQDKIDGGKGYDTFVLTTSNTVAQTVHIDVNNKGNLVISLDGGDEGGELELKDIENLKLQFGLAGATIELGDNAGEVLGSEPLAVSGGEGSDDIDASTSSQSVNIDAGTGDDAVTGGSAADTISGGEGSDVITGGGGDDVIDAGVGDDRVIWRAGDGNDTIDGGEGFDEVALSLDETVPSSLSIAADENGNVILISDDGSQLALDGVEDIVINAGSGGSTITIGDLTGTDIAQDTLYFVGGAGVDSLDASATDRRINATGNAGDDTLVSGSGNDTLDGGDGNDVLDAGSGTGVDTILGGAGDDQIKATLGDEQAASLALDIVDGGADNDELEVLFVEPTPHDLFLQVNSNGDGTFTVTSRDGIVEHENLHVSNVETLRLVAGEGALNFELNTLSDTTLAANGVEFAGSIDADFLDASATDIEVQASGGDGNDTLLGGISADALYGNAGNDSLSGGAGSDVLVGGSGDDIIDGGEGFDVADYSNESAAVTVSLGLFTQQDTGGAGLDTLVNVESVIGSGFDDNLTASAAGSTLTGGSGNDVLTGGDGWDDLSGGTGDDTLVDTAGNGNLQGNAGDDYIDGRASYHSDLSAVFVNYTDTALDVHGDGSLILAARTALDGYGDTDTFGAAAQSIDGSAFSDFLFGSDTNNHIFGRAGDDAISAQGGNDIIFAGSGADIIDGGAGFDFINFQDDGADHSGAPSQGVSANLATGIVTDQFGDTDSVSNVEGIVGSEGSDTLIGNSEANTLLARGGDDTVSGGAGDDTLAGWSGDDTISGDEGHDVIIGDVGDDILSGGLGADTYRFATFADASGDFGHDTITDFDVTQDILDLSLFEVENIADFQAISADDGTNTTISIGVNRSITLNGVTVEQFSASNFVFSETSGTTGTNANDVIDGTEDTDTIDALAGDDVINGLGGDDTLYGSEGNDILNGGAGADALYGGIDNDTLAGGQGDDLLDGGDGNDSADYSADPASVTVNLASGTATDGYGDTDTLVGISSIIGSINSDVLTGDDENNFINADNGNGGSGSDIIAAGGGNDYIWGGRGIDTIDGGAGLDFLSFTAEDVTSLGPGLNITMANDGSMNVTNTNNGEIEDSITGIEGVLASRGSDTFVGNDEDNFYNPFFGNDTADGGGGTDTLFFGILNGVYVDLDQGFAFRPSQASLGTTNFVNFENVIGNANDDTLIGNAGDNILEGIDGNDTLRGGDGADTLHGGSFTELPIALFMGADDPNLDGIDVADYSVDPGAVSVDLVAGTAMDGWGNSDSLISIDGAIGSNFADTLLGDSRNNVFEGRGGNDTITGGAGADSYVLSDDGDGGAAFGLDIVTDFEPSEDIIDVKQFPDIQSINDLTISSDGADALITFDAANVVRLAGVVSSALGASNFVFAEFLNIVGSEDSDNLVGGSGNDTIAGLGGNDNLNGAGGNDVIDGGTGSDFIDGGSGHDTLSGGSDTDWDDFRGGEGNDVINIGAGGSYVEGGAGNDTITGSNDWWDHVVGGEGDDTLIDPDGSGFLIGGPGNDTIDGRAVYLEDPAGVAVNLYLTDWDIHGDASRIIVSREAEDGYGDIDQLAPSTTQIAASNFGDYIKGSEFRNQFDGYAGNDTLLGMGGDDNFNPGSGNDFIDGGADWDHIGFWNLNDDSAGLGNHGVVANLSTTDFDYGAGIAVANSIIDNYGDTDAVFNIESLRGTDFDDVIVGAEYHNWLDGGAGNDQIFAGQGNGDNLVGGAGDDYLSGQAGDWDTAWYHNTDVLTGIDVDLAAGTASDGHGGTDTLVGIEGVEGSEYADTIVGDGSDNNLSGREGNDVIFGGDGHDTLRGGEGADELFGETGNDWLEASPGDDLLDGGSSDFDTANFAPWTGTTSGVTLNLSQIVTAGGYTNVVVASDGFAGTDYLRDIENIHGSDHDDNLTGNSANNRFEGFAGNDHLVGGGGNDWLHGDDDFDILEGGDGDDWLDGGENDDLLTGGSGRDQFRFTQFTNENNQTSFGQDTVTDFNISEDVLDLYSVPQFHSLTDLLSAAVQDDTDVVISFITNTHGVDETNSIRIQNIDLSDLPNMEIWLAPIQGTGGDDVLDGGPNGEMLEGLGGNDILNGNGGQDNLHGGAGNDQLFGGDEDDWLSGGEGSDLIDGGSGQDNVNFTNPIANFTGITVDLSNVVANAGGYSNVVVVANDGSGSIDYLRNVEHIHATRFNDSLTGDAGDNAFNGDAGDDNLVGGPGNDWFDPGPGNDVIDGGADWDNLSYNMYSGVTQGVDVNLASGVVANDGFGGADTVSNIERVSGSPFNDIIIGDANNNHLLGGAGNDTLNGGAGSDSLEGGEGDDTLIVSDNGDYLVGGSGNDIFILSDGVNATIEGFIAGAGTDDVLDLSNISALADFAAVIAAADESQGHVEIDLDGVFDGVNVIELTGVATIAELDSGDFIF